jgi:hypothetical protein
MTNYRLETLKTLNRINTQKISLGITCSSDRKPKAKKEILKELEREKHVTYRRVMMCDQKKSPPETLQVRRQWSDDFIKCKSNFPPSIPQPVKIPLWVKKKYFPKQKQRIYC